MKAAKNGLKRRRLMQFALLIYHSPEEFAMRKNDYNGPYVGAWRAYYKALVEAGVHVGANALEVPETGTTVRLKGGKAPRAGWRPLCRHWQDSSSCARFEILSDHRSSIASGDKCSASLR
jgi:hypothetical protein